MFFSFDLSNVHTYLGVTLSWFSGLEIGIWDEPRPTLVFIKCIPLKATCKFKHTSYEMILATYKQ